MVLLILAALASTPPAPAAPVVRARASIRVLQGASITAESWRRQATPRETIVNDEAGRQYRLRTIDFE